jgi:hypothetical protein
LFEAAWKNPRTLGFVFTLTLIYCHLGPFARHVVSVLDQRLALPPDEHGVENLPNESPEPALVALVGG